VILLLALISGCKKDEAKDPTVNRSWTEMFLWKQRLALMWCSSTRTAIPFFTLVLVERARPFPDHCLLRRGVPEEQGSEQDMGGEMHPRSVAQGATLLTSAAEVGSQPNPGLGCRSALDTRKPRTCSLCVVIYSSIQAGDQAAI